MLRRSKWQVQVREMRQLSIKKYYVVKKKRKKMPDVLSEEHFIGSVYHLIFYGNTIRGLSEKMIDIGRKTNAEEKKIVQALIQSKTLLDTVSLIDELNNYLFRYECDDMGTVNRITSYKHIVQPLLDQIGLWNGIRQFRNNVLAHNFRIDNQNFESVLLSNKLHTYDIPSSSLHLAVLFKIIDVITKVAEEIFSQEYERAQSIINGFDKKKTNPKHSIDEELSKANTVLEEVNKRIESYNASLVRNE